MTFATLGVSPRLLSLLEAKGITQPTPIQSKAIPIAATGADLVAIAQTGTGKTLAFGLPALARLAEMPRGITGMLVLAPTRELAQQVNDVIAPLAKPLGLSTACVYGGVGMEPQAQALRRGTSIIVACPGRLLDHIQRGNTRFRRLALVVLDEADRMLDMGFLPDIKRILSTLPAERQTMMFSATFPTEITRLAAQMMRSPERVEAGPVARPADAVRQSVFSVGRAHKTKLLVQLLAGEEATSTLVFVKTKHGSDRLAEALERAGIAAEPIHGGQSQNQRARALNGFRAGRHRVLVATDVAARGIDVKGISHVINFDVPATTEDYIHRIGRTARANATGEAITFVTPEDLGMLRAIERHIGKSLERVSWEGAVSLEEEYRPTGASRRSPPGGYRVNVTRPWR